MMDVAQQIMEQFYFSRFCKETIAFGVKPLLGAYGFILADFVRKLQPGSLYRSCSCRFILADFVRKLQLQKVILQKNYKFYFSRFCKETIAVQSGYTTPILFYFSRFCKETIAYNSSHGLKENRRFILADFVRKLQQPTLSSPMNQSSFILADFVRKLQRCSHSPI